MLRKILSIGILLFISLNAYAHKNMVACKPSQLKMSLLAINSPGMMQANLLYGIINQGKSACAILSNLGVWAVESNGNAVKIVMRQGDKFPVNKHKFIKIVPPQHKDYINANDLVWFSLHSAHDDAHRFFKILVKIPKTSKGKNEFVNLIGDNGDDSTSLTLSNPIMKGQLINWAKPLGDEECVFTKNASFKYLTNSEFKSNKPIKVYFKRTANCG